MILLIEGGGGRLATLINSDSIGFAWTHLDPLCRIGLSQNDLIFERGMSTDPFSNKFNADWDRL